MTTLISTPCIARTAFVGTRGTNKHYSCAAGTNTTQAPLNFNQIRVTLSQAVAFATTVRLYINNAATGLTVTVPANSTTAVFTLPQGGTTVPVGSTYAVFVLAQQPLNGSTCHCCCSSSNRLCGITVTTTLANVIA